jgi:hypothetical protein
MNPFIVKTGKNNSAKYCRKTSIHWIDLGYLIGEYRQTLASHHRVSVPRPGNFMSDMWWTKLHWSRFLSEFLYVFLLANHHSTIAPYSSITTH